MAKIVENALVIYTDGSCHPKGRRGGFGILFLHYDEVGNEIELDNYIAPSLKGTTSQRMELEACVTALKMAPSMSCYNHVDSVVIRTDSQYIATYHLSALTHWRKNKWRNYSGKAVDNAELWQHFVRAYKKITKAVRIEKVKAHGRGRNKDPHNDAADKLARASANNPLKRTEHRSTVRRKLSPYKTEGGSIRMEGQKIVLRIIETVPLRVHRTTKYRCEVVSTDSPYFQRVDWLYSSADLRHGHTYEVLLNSDQGNPTIVEMLGEIDAGTGNETASSLKN